MKNAWLIRPYPYEVCRLNEFLKNNFIAIAWSDTNNLQGKSKEDIKEILSKPPFSYSGAQLGSLCSNVNIFVNDISIGDLILAPKEDEIYCGEISGDYFFNSTEYQTKKPKSAAHQRSVKWNKTPIMRDDLPLELRNSLKSPKTAANLSKHFEDIEKLYNTGRVDNVFEQTFISTAYPLRQDLNVEISFPSNMNEIEAERLGNFVKTLYYQ